MESIIPHCTPESKPSSYRSSPTRLTKLEYNLLRLFYDDHMVQGFTDRGRDELAKRFNKHKSTISKALSDLEEYEFITNKKRGKGRTSILCITMDGFCYLENQPRHQTRHQNSSIPYIDLFKKEEDPILKCEHICEQLPEFEPESDIIKKLDNFFEQRMVSQNDRIVIKGNLHASRIGQIRTERLIERIINPKQPKHIKSPRSFFLRCIQNEQKELRELFKVFKGKNVSVNYYAQQ
jgi:hypothetical protein